MLPPFTDDGLLPVGRYPLSLAEFLESHLVTGQCSNQPGLWDKDRRLHLANNMVVLAHQLFQVGATAIYVFGSFVEDKPSPMDVDAAFAYPNAKDIRHGRLTKKLNALMQAQGWPEDWDFHDKPMDLETHSAQFKLWHRYRVECIPVCPDMNNAMVINGARFPILTGVHLSKKYTIKGVVELQKGPLPYGIEPFTMGFLDC